MKIGIQEIKSSNLKTLTYDSEIQELIVEFNGNVNENKYKYKNVPQKVIESFLQAESKGKYFHSDIKGKYEFEKIINREIKKEI